MAILHWINSPNDDVSQLQDLIAYLLYDHKTSEKKLVDGRGCFPCHALRDFLCIKRLWHKENGSLFEHFILSFSEWNAKHRTQEMMHIAGLIAAYFHRFQCLYAVHTDTDHVHIHFLLNSVSFQDGKKISQSKGDLHRFKAFCNELLHQHQFEAITTPNDMIYCESTDIEGGCKMMTNELNLDIAYDDDVTLEEEHTYANWSEDDEEAYDETAERDAVRDAFQWFRSRMVLAELSDCTEEDDACDSPSVEEYHPSAVDQGDDCFHINNSRNLTIQLDEGTNPSAIAEYLNLCRQSSEEQLHSSFIGITVASALEEQNIRRRIEVDSSINVTLDFRTDTGHSVIKTVLHEE